MAILSTIPEALASALALLVFKKQVALCVVLVILVLIDVVQGDAVLWGVVLMAYCFATTIALASAKPREIQSHYIWIHLLHYLAWAYLLSRYIQFLSDTRR